MFLVNPVAYAPVCEPTHECVLNRRAPATCREACYIPQAANPVALSEERYRRAIAEVRAAEAEYVRAQEAARQEAIKKERRQFLQAEVQRLEREKQKALREERERQAQIELLRRQLLFGEDEEESAATFLRVGHVSPVPVEFLAKVPRHNSAPMKATRVPASLPAAIKGKGKAKPSPSIPLKTRVEERLHKESDKDVEETLQKLLSNIFGYKDPAATPERPAASTSGAQPTPSSDRPAAKAPKPVPAAPLKDRLEERLQKESDKDVEDTLQNLLSSIFGQKIPTTTADVPAASTSGTRSAPPFVPEKTEGANLARTRKLSATADSASTASVPAVETATATESASIFTSAPVAEPSPALSAINAVARSLKALTATFVFPRTLDFTPPDSPDASDDEHEGLAYTPTNAPVRAYEHALNHLLERLDEVESEGDEEVRRRRKEVVKDVEKALADVDRRLGEMRAAERVGEVKVAAEVDVQAVVETTEAAVAPQAAPAVEAVEAPSVSQSYSIPIIDGTLDGNDEVKSVEAAALAEAVPAAMEADNSQNPTQTNDASVINEAPALAADVQEPSSMNAEEPANTSPQIVTIVISEPDTVPTARETDDTAAAGAEETASPVGEDIDTVDSPDFPAAGSTESPAAGTESPASKSADSLVVAPAAGSENMEPATADISENAEPQNAASVDATHDQPSSHIDAPVPVEEAVHLDVAAPLSAPASAEPAYPSSSAEAEAEVALPEETEVIVQDMDSTPPAESSPGPEFLSALSEEQFTFPSAPMRDEEDAVMVEKTSDAGSEHSWEHVDA